MKKKLVLWGTDENDKKILLAAELLTDENKVQLYVFNEEMATEDFHNTLRNLWKSDQEVSFPEGHITLIRELSVTEDLLPETIKVERTDVINRAKTEWHFIVLSHKMYAMYRSELDDIKEKVNDLTEFDSGVWEEMKGFWAKVQTQMREKNLFREHLTDLKETTNGLFESLKKLRKSLDEEFKSKSKEQYGAFMTKLVGVEEKIEKGLGLQPLFEELKKLQSEYRVGKFTRDDRNKIWKRLDKAFKDVKEKRFGTRDENASGVSRLQRRYNGLLDAIGKMEKSIKRDVSDRDYHNRKAANTDSQIEAQLKKAKIMMVEERITSKESKLKEMLSTKTDLEARIAKEKVKEEEKAKKEQIKKVQKEVKEKIAEDIKKTEEKLDVKSDKLEKAAKEIKESKTKKKAAKKVEDKKAALTPEEGAAVSLTDTVENVVESVTEVAKDIIEAIEDKVEDVIEVITGEEE